MGLNRFTQGLLSGLALALIPLLLIALYLGASHKTGAVATKHPSTSSPSPSRGTEPTPTPFDNPSPTSTNKASNAALAAFFAPDFSGKTFCKFSHQHASISGSTLTVGYPKGSTAPSGGAPYGGAQLCVPFAAGSAIDATLTYEVRFPVGFDFVKGGKLPGLYGGKTPFSGGKHNPDGWSMRLMWREQGTAEVYGYISTSTGYGDEWPGGGLAFQADGKWHRLALHIHLNSPGLSDGYVTLAYDGTEYIRKTGLPITTTNTSISGLYFSTFYGGHDPSWAPPADMHIDFASFNRS